jgi:hypothetical protein
MSASLPNCPRPCQAPIVRIKLGACVTVGFTDSLIPDICAAATRRN